MGCFKRQCLRHGGLLGGRALSPDVPIGSLAAACRAQLADYKVPERWGVVGTLPRNAMGKVVRTGVVDLLDESE